MIAWQPGATRYYIESRCGRYTISKQYTGDQADYTAWARGPTDGPAGGTRWTAIRYTPDLDAAKAACAAHAAVSQETINEREGA